MDIELIERALSKAHGLIVEESTTVCDDYLCEEYNDVIEIVEEALLHVRKEMGIDEQYPIY